MKNYLIIILFFNNLVTYILFLTLHSLIFYFSFSFYKTIIYLMFKISKNNVIHKIDDVTYIEITGSKNSALPILCSLPLTRGILKIDNIYDYEDILNTFCILSQLNIKYFKNCDNQYVFDTNNIILSSTIDGCHKLRASYYFIGSMIHNKTILVYGYPGGCNIGTRKIDEHIRFFEAIGCKIDINKNNIIVDSSNFFYDSSF